MFTAFINLPPIGIFFIIVDFIISVLDFLQEIWKYTI